MNNSVIGLDIAKNIFHMYTFVEGKSVKKKLRRAELLAFFANYPASLICRELWLGCPK
jgi:transposase